MDAHLMTGSSDTVILRKAARAGRSGFSVFGVTRSYACQQVVSHQRWSVLPDRAGLLASVCANKMQTEHLATKQPLPCRRSAASRRMIHQISRAAQSAAWRAR